MLPKIIRYWGAIGGVCDGTGIGEPLAYHLKELFDRNNDGLVEAYKFKAAGDESKSKLGYLAYDFNHNDLIKVPKAPEDPDQMEGITVASGTPYKGSQTPANNKFLCPSERRTT